MTWVVSFSNLSAFRARSRPVNTQVRIEKINVEVMGRWVAERLAELLGFEDDVLSELVKNAPYVEVDGGQYEINILTPTLIGCDLGVPRCCGAFTPSTRVVSRRGGRGWFLF